MHSIYFLQKHIGRIILGYTVKITMNRITMKWQYSKEIEQLKEFKDTYLHYTNLVRLRNITQEQRSERLALREKINNTLCEIEDYVRKSGVPISVYYSPPPAVGGLAGTIHIFQQIFHLGQFDITPQMIFDALDRSIGNYKYLQTKFKKRIFNPFYWIGEVIRLPFHLFKFAGFNSVKIEKSFGGKLYKFVVGFIAFIGAVIQILNFIGIQLSDILPK